MDSFIRDFEKEYMDKSEFLDMSIVSQIDFSSVGPNSNVRSNAFKDLREQLMKAIFLAQKVYIKNDKLVVKNPSTLAVFDLTSSNVLLEFKPFYLSYGTFYQIKLTVDSKEVVLGYFPSERENYARSLFEKYNSLISNYLKDKDII